MADSVHPPTTRKTALAPDVRRMDERSARAWVEHMAVRPVGEAKYVVESGSGATYVVDLDERSCTCPDHRIRGERCKHMRRVAIEISTRRVPPPGKRRAACAACGTEMFVPREGGDREGGPAKRGRPHLCTACRLEPGDVVRDRETGDRLVVARVTSDRADEVEIPAAGCTVAAYETNDGYPADDPVVEAVYFGDLRATRPDGASLREALDAEDLRRYSFPLSRLEETDAALVG